MRKFGKDYSKVYSEGDAEDLISAQLQKLQWARESVLRKIANPKMRTVLGLKKPDYTLLSSTDGKPMAVIEAKKKGVSLDLALKQGLDYAERLSSMGCFAVFASDGDVVKTAHVSNRKPLMLNDEEVKEILNERILENFRAGRVWSRGNVIKGSKGLIKIFGAASTDLRAEGIVNIDAFAEFSQILFIKIISELYDNKTSILKPPIHWRALAESSGKPLQILYDSALEQLRRHYKDMFRGTDIRNSETLKRIIDKIDQYSFIDINADVKGDAYEWFLRRYNRQKSDLGQYFTPRHVVRAMVILCNPRMGETVYDPFCGTGGMLIEAFKHIGKNHPSDDSDKEKRKLLTRRTIFGADISRSADAARMNMILAGDGHSNIRQLDSLREAKNQKHDVVITNIPFGTGEIKYIQHCMAQVDKSSYAGRLCIIVPERVLDSSQGEYEALRKELLEDWEIRRVVSLPREVFRGLTSAKTSIIYAIYKSEGATRQQKRVKIPYFKVNKDGYTLDKKRDPLPGNNDLDVLLEDRMIGKKCQLHVSEEKSGWKMKPKEAEHRLVFKYPQVPLSELVQVAKRPITITPDMLCREDKMSSALHEIFLKEERYGYNVKTKKRYAIHFGDLVFARLHTQNGLFAISDGNYHCTSSRMVCEIDELKVDADYLFWVLEMVVPTLSKMDTTGREDYSEGEILSLPVPLPSTLQEQKNLVADVKEKWHVYRRQSLADLNESKQFFRENICCFTDE